MKSIFQKHRKNAYRSLLHLLHKL